jgi:hypothetical protein
MAPQHVLDAELQVALAQLALDRARRELIGERRQGAPRPTRGLRIVVST